jgi:RNA polymerase sigma factor (TIGR02999 family)
MDQPPIASSSGSSDAPADPGLTQLLASWAGGDRAALDRLIPFVYDELLAMAHRELGRERPGHTLDTVALVNEVYVKLAGQRSVRWENRAHFFAIAARSIRSVLVDHARARAAAKRGGGGIAVTLDRIAEHVHIADDDRLLALDDALRRLAEVDPDGARMVECRYFAGLNLEEIAAALDTSVATVRRRWAFARAWLQRELSPSA